MGLMLDPKNCIQASLADLDTAPRPPETDTYHPLPFGDFARNVATIGNDLLSPKGLKLGKMELGLTKDGLRMFGLSTWSDPNVDGIDFCMGFRGSYDKRMAPGFCAGGSVIVCSNLMLTGEIAELHKNTPAIVEYMREKLVLSFHRASGEWENANSIRSGWADYALSDDQAYSLFGRAYGHGILAPHQFSRCVQEWKRPTHEDFKGRNLWSAYNAGTESLKSTPIPQQLQRHVAWHTMARDLSPVGQTIQVGAGGRQMIAGLN